MAKTHVTTDSLTIDVRSTSGTTAARAVRRAGNVPGVLYGHGEPTAISVPAKALEELLTGHSKSHILNASIGGKADSVLLRDVQRDPVNHRPIHADFQRVTQSEEITATVPVVLTGTSVAVKEDGAVLDSVTREVDLKGPAGNIPENLSVDITNVPLHAKITAGDLTIPAGFTLLTAPETVIVTVEPSRTAVAAEEAAAAQAEDTASTAPPAPAADTAATI